VFCAVSYDGKISTGIETEIKLRVHTPKWAMTLLNAQGFTILTPRHLETNVVLDTDAQSLRMAGELLRVREAQGRAIVTFKGHAQESRHKARLESEMEVTDAGAALAVFENLGYKIRFRYEKYRTEYHRQGEAGIVTLDETPVGDFMELEGPSLWIDAMARKLGYDESQYILESYGRIYLDYCRENGIQPTNMVFPPHSRF